MIPSINNYIDLLDKVKFDFHRFKDNSNHPYDLMNCLLGLNAVPEWLKNDKTVNIKLNALGKKIDSIMADTKIVPFDLSKIETSVEHQLKFIRLYCNHSKHKTNHTLIPKIEVTGGSFPYRLPIKFYNFIIIGDDQYDIEHLINNVIQFWDTEISNAI